MQPSREGDALPGPATSAAAGLTDSDEARLIGRIAAGELRAFEAMYRAYHPRLTRFLERMTRRPGLVDEVLNDTLLVVWHRAGRYNGCSKVSTWIFGIAYRKALKALQRFDAPVSDVAPTSASSGAPAPNSYSGSRSCTPHCCTRSTRCRRRTVPWSI